MRRLAVALASWWLAAAPSWAFSKNSPLANALAHAASAGSDLAALFDGSAQAHSRLQRRPSRRPRAAMLGDSLDSWISREADIARTRMLANVSPQGAAPGSVAASPSRQDPNYYYSWVRDSALVMDSVVGLYEKSPSGAGKQGYYKTLMDYARFSRNAQTENSLTGLGEPKFNMDGTAFSGPWARPQDDGPALRALTMMRFARDLLAQGRGDLVRSLFYDGKLPTATLIKADLEFVAHHWGDAGFCLWEEVYGRHFFTGMMQRKALILGARFARDMGDPGAASYYQAQVAPLSQALEKHWNAQQGAIVPTLDQQGMSYKNGGLDSSVIVAVLRGETGDGFFSPIDDRVLSTASRQRRAFQALYPVNSSSQSGDGVAIGRYPEDRYFGGNPWVLLTEAYGQLYYRAALEFERKGAIPLNALNIPFWSDLAPASASSLKPGATLHPSDPLFGTLIASLKGAGDAQENVVREHANPDGSLSEQIDRKSGAMESARDLSWNYSAFLDEDAARQDLARSMARARR